jgi:hypothetical protein
LLSPSPMHTEHDCDYQLFGAKLDRLCDVCI